MSRRAGRKQEVCSASTQYGSLNTQPNCLIRSETTRKPQCYTASGQRPPSLTAGRVCFLLIRVQVEGQTPQWLRSMWPRMLLMEGVVGWGGHCCASVAKPGPRAQPGGEGQRAQNRPRLFASSEHLESLWFLWEIWEAGGGAEAACASEATVS